MYSENNGEDDLSPKTDQEAPEVMVVPLRNAGAKPYAVMVPFEHAVVAVIAVARPRRSEDLAGFAVLQLGQVCSLHVDVVVEDLLSVLNVGVSLGS